MRLFRRGPIPAPSKMGFERDAEGTDILHRPVDERLDGLLLLFRDFEHELVMDLENHFRMKLPPDDLVCDVEHGLLHDIRRRPLDGGV